MTEPALIRVERLNKHYVTGAGVTVHALKDVDLTIQTGEFVAVMGPSGSGKSTFMNILGCLDTPSDGRYYLKDQDVSAFDVDQLAQVRNQFFGFVFQGFNLLSRLDAAGNVALPLLYAGVEAAERERRAAALLESVGLGHVAHHHPNQLSGGQQQRVAIARALVNDPELILADEPTGNLDTQTSQEIMQLFAQLNATRHITVVLVTHEVDIARFARRLVRFTDGRVVADGATAKLLKAPRA